jgi:hypothetical protein
MKSTETIDLTKDQVKSPKEQSTVGLVRSIASDTTMLVRKEVELAKQEITEAISARVKAAAAMAVAGVLGLFVLAFLAAAAAAALDKVMAAWLSRLIVAGGFALLALGGLAFGIRRMKVPPLAPTETKRTVKEDVEWARAQLKR